MSETTLGMRLEQALADRGMQHQTLAKNIGVTITTMSRYIHDNRVPETPILIDICKHLHISVDWLLGLSDSTRSAEQMSIDSIKVKKALGRIRSLGLKDEIATTEDVFDGMKNYTLFEIADTFREISNLLYELKDLLESDEVTE
jgi:transcriptional regulator with XRE-family HTH domain